MNMSSVLRKHLKADNSHTIPILLPPEMVADVDVIIYSGSPNKVMAEQESCASLGANSFFSPRRGLWSISGTCPRLRLCSLNTLLQ